MFFLLQVSNVFMHFRIYQGCDDPDYLDSYGEECHTWKGYATWLASMRFRILPVIYILLYIDIQSGPHRTVLRPRAQVLEESSSTAASNQRRLLMKSFDHAFLPRIVPLTNLKMLLGQNASDDSSFICTLPLPTVYTDCIQYLYFVLFRNVPI